MNYSNEQKRKFVKYDYNAIADLYANDKKNIEIYSEYIAAFAKGLENKSVLDIGCGSGEFANLLKENGCIVKAIDFSEKLIEIAKERYSGIDFEEVDVCAYKTTQVFDGIFSKDMFFHLPDDDLEMVTKKCHDMLPRNGKLCLVMDIPKKPGEEIYPEPLDENYTLYYNYLSQEKIENLLKRNGFIIENIEHIKSEDLYVYAQGIMVIYAKKQ